MQMDENQIRHLINMHKEAISQLELQIAERPVEPEYNKTNFPAVVGFYRLCQDYPTDHPADRPFVAIRYNDGNGWYLNRGGGAPSGPLTWDELLDWIEHSHWDSIRIMMPMSTRINLTEHRDQPQSQGNEEKSICTCDGEKGNIYGCAVHK